MPRPVTPLLPLPLVRKALAAAERKGYARGLAAGKAEATDLFGVLLKSVRESSAHPIRDSRGQEWHLPTQGGGEAEGDADPYGSLLEAALSALISARDSGDDTAVPGIVAAYRAHLDDPDLIGAALAPQGPAVAKSLGLLLLKAGRWDGAKHPRDRTGRFISRDAIQAAADPAKADVLRDRVAPGDAGKLEAALADQGGTVGRTKRGQAAHEAGGRRGKKAADHRRAGEVADKVAAGAATYEEMQELGDHLEGLTLDKLRALQSRIATAGGGRRKAEVVAALRASLDAERKRLHGGELAASDEKAAVLREAVGRLVEGGATDEEVVALLGRGPGAETVGRVLAEARASGGAGAVQPPAPPPGLEPSAPEPPPGVQAPAGRASAKPAKKPRARKPAGAAAEAKAADPFPSHSGAAAAELIARNGGGDWRASRWTTASGGRPSGTRAAGRTSRSSCAPGRSTRGTRTWCGTSTAPWRRPAG